MTVASQTRSWQSNPVGGAGDPIQPPAAPSLFPILDWLLAVHGGASLSSPDLWHDRPVRGGSAPSSHRGAAFDWRYDNPGPGRDHMLNQVLPTLLWFSYELNIQQIHDYWGCRVWKASRVVGGNPDTGWARQTPGSHSGMMGESWAAWLHIEAGTWGWYDGRSVAEKLGAAGGDEFDMATLDELRAIVAQESQRVMSANIWWLLGFIVAPDGSVTPDPNQAGPHHLREAIRSMVDGEVNEAVHWVRPQLDQVAHWLAAVMAAEGKRLVTEDVPAVAEDVLRRVAAELAAATE